jgi:hypothetical protein
MHANDVWVEKDAIEEDPTGLQQDAIKLIQYLDNDEWLIEYGVWDIEDNVFSSDREFIQDMANSATLSPDDEEIMEEVDDEDIEDIMTGQEIFRDYVKVHP